MNVAPPARERRILSLGDSYTIGEGVAPADRWPARLAALLRERGMAIAEPAIVARTGWTTDELDAGIDQAALAPPYDAVTLMIGVNDQYRGRSAADYRPEFRALLARAVALAGGAPARTIVLSIPDWGVMPFAADRDRPRIARELDELNAINRAEAAHAGAQYVDVTVASRRAAGDLSMVGADGLHPSAPAHDTWARLVLPVALDALADSDHGAGRGSSSDRALR